MNLESALNSAFLIPYTNFDTIRTFGNFECIFALARPLRLKGGGIGIFNFPDAKFMNVQFR